MSRVHLVITAGIAATLVGLFIGFSPIHHSGDNTCGSAFVPDSWFQCPDEQSSQRLLAFVFLIPGGVLLVSGLLSRGKKGD
ncbi:hypothetical protein [Streptosporangium canum]|uniref:hypothetical protein n=1 Tax=Streptosporangium canum TaxID=324952 RepID=UPI003443BE6A